ncbi:MAG: shikimate dehydrogenase [Anaerolineales bacterium]|nr:shikimate dehydrogenase [Anaerolineae bacterium]PWB56608.1 MAG: shikimate dehydrogenase [Anaerolineales bacterium]
MTDQNYHVVTKTIPTFYFIGVTTTKSSIMKVFPLWMKILGREEVVMEGIDCKIHDKPEAYRQAVAQIKVDPLSLGALVTTHKIDLLSAARDMFEYLDPYALITGEVSCISKLEGRLEGHAKDPLTSGASLDAIIEPGYFGRTNGQVLCFGAGGSGVATLLHLINKKNKADRPARFTFVNRSQGRLDHAREMVSGLSTDIEIEYICNSDPAVNDKIMEKFPPYSIVINATGMGKDTPGSPITWDGKFPMHSIAWEFNYRGELDFMHQSLAQVESRKVRVEDGWLYFVHGWTQVVAQVMHFDLTPALFDQLNQAASTMRGK